MFDNLFGKFPLSLGPLKDKISDADYFAICQLNECLLIERNKDGDWEIQSLNGVEDALISTSLTAALGHWAKKDGTGIGFGALTGFTLPNGAVRAPDVAWVSLARRNALPPEKRERFAHIAPDFVVELRSASDSLKDLQDKMQEYIANGVQLGWLIDTKRKRVYIYRPGKAVQSLTNPATLSGEDVLPDFILNMHEIWSYNTSDSFLTNKADSRLVKVA